MRKGVSTGRAPFRGAARYFRRLLVRGISAVSLAVWLAPAQAGIPAKVLFQDYEFTRLRLSPDGNRLAVRARIAGRPNYNLVVIDLQTLRPRQVTGLKTADVWRFWWASNDRLLFRTRDEHGFPVGGLQLVALDGKRYREYVAGSYSRRSYAHPDSILVYNRSRRGGTNFARINVNTQSEKTLARGEPGHQQWVADRADVVRAKVVREVTKNDSWVDRFYYRDSEDAEWALMWETVDGKNGVVPLGFDGDNRTLYVKSDVDRHNWAIFEFDTAKRALGRLVFGHDAVDVERLIFSRSKNAVVGVRYYEHGPQAHYLDPERRDLIRQLHANFPDHRVSTQFTDDGRRAVLWVHSDRSPGTYYLWEKQTNRIRKLLTIASWIDEKQMVPMEPVTYEARDGLTIHGFLSRPANTRGPAPLVVVPHGGPFGVRDEWGFDRVAQYFSSHGYAVLRINFRGSSGYGEAFIRAGYGEWGGKMQDDVSDGVRWAIGQGIADPDRVCIFGGSYGGYAAAMGLIRTPELYRCGVVYVGVTDLLQLTSRYKHVRGYAKHPVLAWADRAIGDRWKDRRRLADTSPVNLAQHIQDPVFIVHGKRDPVVPILHAVRFRKALERHGKEFDWYVEDKEGHGFYKSENRIELYSRVLDFLNRHTAR